MNELRPGNRYMNDLRRSLANAKAKLGDRERALLKRLRKERMAEEAMNDLLALVPDEQPSDRSATICGLSPLVRRLAVRTATAARQRAVRDASSFRQILELGLLAVVSSLGKPPEERKEYLQEIIDGTAAQLAGAEPSPEALVAAATRSLSSMMALDMLERNTRPDLET